MLNSREQAIVIWGIVFLVFVVMQKGVRTAILNVIVSLFRLLRHPIFIFMNVYIIFVFIVVYICGLIGVSLVKDYVVWIVTALYPLIFKVSTKYKEAELIKIFFETFKLSIIPMFIINEYTLSLWAELLIVPVSVLIGGLLVVAKSDEKYILVKKLLDYLLMIIGFIFIVFAFKGFLFNVKDAAELEFWKKMFMDIIGITLHIPLLVFVQIASLYEQIIVRTKITKRWEKLLACLVLFRECNFSKKVLMMHLRNYKFKQVGNVLELQLFLKNSNLESKDC